MTADGYTPDDPHWKDTEADYKRYLTQGIPGELEGGSMEGATGLDRVRAAALLTNVVKPTKTGLQPNVPPVYDPREPPETVVQRAIDAAKETFKGSSLGFALGYPPPQQQRVTAQPSTAPLNAPPEEVPPPERAKGLVERIAGGAGYMAGSPVALGGAALEPVMGPAGPALGFAAQRAIEGYQHGEPTGPLARHSAEQGALGLLAGILGSGAAGMARGPVTRAVLPTVTGAGALGLGGEAVQAAEEGRSPSLEKAGQGAEEQLALMGAAHLLQGMISTRGAVEKPSVDRQPVSQAEGVEPVGPTEMGDLTELPPEPQFPEEEPPPPPPPRAPPEEPPGPTPLTRNNIRIGAPPTAGEYVEGAAPPTEPPPAEPDYGDELTIPPPVDEPVIPPEERVVGAVAGPRELPPEIGEPAGKPPTPSPQPPPEVPEPSPLPIRVKPSGEIPLGDEAEEDPAKALLDAILENRHAVETGTNPAGQPLPRDMVEQARSFLDELLGRAKEQGVEIPLGEQPQEGPPEGLGAAESRPGAEAGQIPLGGVGEPVPNVPESLRKRNAEYYRRRLRNAPGEPSEDPDVESYRQALGAAQKNLAKQVPGTAGYVAAQRSVKALGAGMRAAQAEAEHWANLPEESFEPPPRSDLSFRSPRGKLGSPERGTLGGRPPPKPPRGEGPTEWGGEPTPDEIGRQRARDLLDAYVARGEVPPGAKASIRRGGGPKERAPIIPTSAYAAMAARATPEELAEPPVGPPPPKAKNINLERISTADDVKHLLAKVADSYGPQIEEAHRGTITHEETQKLADALGMTADTLMTRRRGQALNAEQATAARQILVTSAERVHRMAEEAVGGDQDSLVRFTDALQQHAAIQAEVSGMTAEAGRALSAFRIQAEAGSEAKLRRIQDVLRQLGGAGKAQQAAEMLTAFAPGDVTGISRFIDALQRHHTWDKLLELWRNFLVSGPPTQVAKALSDTAIGAMRVGERTMAGGIDAARVRLTGGKQERFAGEGAAAMLGWSRGFTQGVQKYLAELRAGLYGPPEMAEGEWRTSYGAIGGRTGRIIRMPTTHLRAITEGFKAINETAEQYAQAFRQAAMEGKTGQPRWERMAELLGQPDELRDWAANRESLYATLQTPAGPKLTWFMEARQHWPILEFVTPFLRTGTNGLLMAGERIGPFNILRREMSGRGFRGGNLSEALAKATMGTLLMTAAGNLVFQDRMTGGTADRKERGEIPAYGLKTGDGSWIGGYYTGYRRILPIGTLLALGADVAEVWKDHGTLELEDAAAKLGKSLVGDLENHLFTAELSDFLNAVHDPERHAAYFDRFAGSAIPNLVAYGAKATDPVERRPKGLEQTLEERIPGLRENVPALRDIWGRVELSPEPSLERFVSPFKRVSFPPDRATDEVRRLKVPVGSPSQHLQLFKQPVTLNETEYERYVEAAGARAHKDVLAFVQSPGYRRLTDDEKAQGIKARITSARNVERPSIKMQAAKRQQQEQGRARELLGGMRATGP
jgi:hypothetical protein